MPIQMYKDSDKISVLWKSTLGMSVVIAKVNLGQAVIWHYGEAFHLPHASCSAQNYTSSSGLKRKPSKTSENTVYPVSVTSSVSDLCFGFK